MRRRNLVMLALLPLVSGCNRWRPNEARTLYFRHPQVAWDMALVVLQRHGYHFQPDPNRYHIEVAAKLDRGGTRRSYISIQVFDDASLEIRVHGDHVLSSEGKMHRKLAAEVDDLTQALLATGQAVR
ncbi:MAG: hypothetical protein DRI90_09385 [Deltaproteobacteria bacterium]|nr:MAG: hypothetical protein DRI90_09385 [Deltaproteobacteria bacterium]